MRNTYLALIPFALALGCSGSNTSNDQGPVSPPQENAPVAAPSPGGAANIDLQGAGATFPYPLYSKWVSEYQKADSRVRINYQSIGSGGGIRQSDRAHGRLRRQ